MSHFSRRYFSVKRMIFILGEFAFIYCSVWLTTYLIKAMGIDIIDMLELYWAKFLVITVITIICFYINDLYEFSTEAVIDIVYRMIRSVGYTAITLAIIYFCRPGMVIETRVFVFSILLLFILLFSWRLLFSLILNKMLFTERALMIGSGTLAKDVLEEIGNRRDVGFNIIAVIDHADLQEESNFPYNIPLHFGFDNLIKMVKDLRVSYIIVAMDEKRGLFPYKQLLQCRTKGVTIIEGESFYEGISGKLVVESIKPSWLIFSDGFAKSRNILILKRMSDVILSTILLITLSPLMLFVAIVIKLESRGPLIFVQERVGENEKIFNLYKFRSMKEDAEAKSGPVWASDNDPRITFVGNIIRKTRIDELPQLINVIRGDMSFVGPRPERYFFVEKLKNKIPYYKERFTVKPGLTGWAQVRYNYGASEEDSLEKLKYDLYYIKNISLLLDLISIFHTTKIVLLRRGSR